MADCVYVVCTLKIVREKLVSQNAMTFIKIRRVASAIQCPLILKYRVIHHKSATKNCVLPAYSASFWMNNIEILV